MRPSLLMTGSLLLACALAPACGEPEPAAPAGIELSVTTDKPVYSLSADQTAQPILVNRGVREVYLPMNEYVAVQRFEAGAWSEPQPWFAVDGVGISFPLAAGDTLRAYPMSFAYVGRQVGVYRFIFEVAADPNGRTILDESVRVSAPFEVQQ